MAQMVFMFALSVIASAVISFLFPAEGPRLKDLSVSASTYGNVVPEVWGTVRVAGNMIYSSNIIEHKKKAKAGLGQFYNKYTYSANFAMAWCRGPAQSVRRIWANGKLIYDVTGNSSSVINGKYQIAIYQGTEEQGVDPTISAAMDGVTPAYRGICYCVFSNFQLEDFGNQLPQMAAEVFVAGDPQPVLTSQVMEEDGTTPLHSYQDDQLAVDSDRGFGYVYHSPGTVWQFDLKTSKRTRVSTPTWPVVENIYDSHNLQRLINCIDDSGNVIGIVGSQNNSRYGFIDPNSLQFAKTFGHCSPFGTPGVDKVAFPDPPWGDDNMYIPNGNSGVSNYSRNTALLNASFGNCFALGAYNGYVKNFGNVYQTRCFCADPNSDGWFVAWGGDAITTPDTLTIDYVQPPVQGLVQVADNVPYTLVNPDGTGGFVPTAICADTSGVIVFSVGTHSWATKWSQETGEIVWQRQIPFAPRGGWEATNILLNQVAWIAGSSRCWIMNTTDGSFVNRAPDQTTTTDNDFLNTGDIEYVNPGESGYTVPSYVGTNTQKYDGATGKLVTLRSTGGTDISIVATNQYGSGDVTLGYIIRQMLIRAGMEPGDYDMSALEGVPVRGYGFGSSTDIKGVISELQQIFLFDFLEIDGQIVAVLRGRDTVDETISWKVLGNTGGNPDSVDYWKESRLSEADIPYMISLKYMNVESDFEQSTAQSKRLLQPVPEVFSRQRDDMEASIVFNPTEAKNRVNAMLYTAWAERTKHNTTLPLAYSYLDPGDMISVTLQDGRNYFERIDQTEFGADYSTQMQTLGQDSGAYQFDLTGFGGDGMGQTLQVPVPATPFIFNTPYLRDQDSVGDGQFSVFYSGVGNLVPQGFNGATMFVSNDSQTYDIFQTYDKEMEWAGIGVIVPGASHGWWALDWETKITLWPAIKNFALASCTDDELWAGANIVIIGDEVLQFRDAEDNGDGSWTISNLLRGRRGTEWAIDTHKLNDRFAFLDTNTVNIGQEPLDSGGKDFWFKAVGTGRDVSTAQTVKITYRCADLMPYAPVQLAGVWNGGDIHVTFQRRTRYLGNMADGTGIVPLNEVTEAYEMDVLDDDGNVIRTVTQDNGATPAANPYVLYSALQISQDFDTQPTIIKVALYQMGIVGRGFGTTAILSLTGTPAPTARFWGASASTSLTESDILALGGEDLANDYIKDITYDCTGGKYPYFCFPASYGTPAHVLVNSLPFSAFTQTTQTVGGNSYHVIRFDGIQHGNSIPVTWK